MVLVAELLDCAKLEDEDFYFAICYYVHGMSEREIADLTGMKRRTVGYRLARFRKQARTLAMGRDDGHDA
jgi:RNA polymerase sigma-70 factor, ECF subfamily